MTVFRNRKISTFDGDFLIVIYSENAYNAWYMDNLKLTEYF